jgi:hypothetical protein
MKVVVEGHVYELNNFELALSMQRIHFLHKEKNRSGALVTIADGTTNEEVLKMLENRLLYLDQMCPCEENTTALSHLVQARHALEARTRRRIAQGTEGTPKEA